MDTIKITDSSASLVKVELNSKGDYAVISTDDATLFDRFVAGFKHVSDIADAVPAKLKEIEKKYARSTDTASKMDKVLEISRANVDFSREAVSVVDSIFGEKTVRKYFRNIYEQLPDFVPNPDCILEFFEKVTPEMEKLFNRKMEERDKLRKQRMSKYQPQDHKRAGSKA